MKDPSDAVQAGVYAALAASTAVKALLGDPVRVYDKVLPDPGYPFTRIGDDQAVDDANGCADGWEVFCTLHTFSRDAIAPRPAVKVIHNALLGVLVSDPPIAATGFNVADVQLVDSRTFMEADGVTCHGVLTVKYRVADT